MRILIADDHTVVRRGIRNILDDEYGDIVFGEASDFSELSHLVRQDNWDLVILDVKMPGGSILNALSAIRISHPAVPVLILSVYPEDQYAVHMLRAGAAGYLTKESVAEDLIEAVRKILSGARYVSSSLAGKLAAGLADVPDRASHETLSEREFQVLIQLATGKSVKQIADQESLSVKTISTYRSRVLKKTGLKTNAEIVRYAVDKGLIP